MPWLVHDGEALGPNEIEQRDSIHIGFGVPVKLLTLTSMGALNCSGTLGTLIGYRNGVEVAAADNALTDSTDCGADDVTFGVTGQFAPDSVIDSLVIVGVDPWTFPVFNLTSRAWLKYTLTYQPVSGRCEAPVTAYSQGDARWGSMTYDRTSSTIRTLGCAMTSLAMLLTFARSPVLPDSLNNFMNANQGFDSGSVNWVRTVRSFTSGALKWHALVGGGARAQLSASVCASHPVVVRVPSAVTAGGTHFVVVTGAPPVATDTTSLTQFKVVDPNGGDTTSLATFGSFALRGYPISTQRPAQTRISRPEASPTEALEPVQADEIQFTVVGGTMLLSDPQGRHLGQTTPGGTVATEIPGSRFDENDRPAPDVPSNAPPGPQVSSAILTEAIGGVYQVALTATANLPGAYLRVDVDLPDSVATTTFAVAVVNGHVYNFSVAYDPASTVAPLIQPTVPAWAPNTAYSVGDSASYNHLDYVCRQAHTSQVGWEPPNVYALWARVAAGATWAPQVLYQVGDTVLYQGVRYRAIQANQSQPGWEPPNVPALWARLQ